MSDRGYGQLRNLWFTRLPEPTMPHGSFDVSTFIHAAVAVRGQHVAVCSETARLRQLRQEIGLGLWHRAYDDATHGSHIEGWLAVDVPVPNAATPGQLIHRMIRRLYFSSVLQGLSEVPQYREAVLGMRSSYLQTRGKVTTKESESSKGNAGLELGFNPLKLAKLTAGQEVTVAEELAAEMERLGVMEAEDQLFYDIQLLLELEGLVTKFGDLVGQTMPRWEQLRAFFQRQYARFIEEKRTFSLRPLFVIDAMSLPEVIMVMELLSAAAGLSLSTGAQMLLVGSHVLNTALRADQELGHVVFRDRFVRHAPQEVVALSPADQDLREQFLTDPSLKLTPAVELVLRTMAPSHARLLDTVVPKSQA